MVALQRIGRETPPFVNVPRAFSDQPRSETDHPTNDCSNL